MNRFARLLAPVLFILAAPAHAVILNYGTFLGGGGNETAYAVAVTASDEVVVVGETDSPDFPTPNGLQKTKGAGLEGFVAKFNAANQLVYGTYLGGANSGDESARAVAVDSSGRIYVAGSTIKNGNEQIFVVRLSADGQTLQYSKTYGGSGTDRAQAIAVDAAGNAYVAGFTESADFPVLNTIQPYGGGADSFVMRLDTNGNITYSTLLGGDPTEQSVDAIAYDPAGFVWITGITRKTEPNGNAYVTRLNFNSTFGEPGEFGRQIGGNSWDEGFGIVLDTSGNAIVTGRAWSTDLPVAGAGFGQAYPGSSSCFIARVTPANVMDKLAYLDVDDSDPFNSEDCHGIALRGSDVWVVADQAYSQTGAVRLRADLSAIDFRFKFSQGDPWGAWREEGHGIAIRSNGHAVVTGMSLSNGFPTTDDAYQHDKVALSDTFLEEVSAGKPSLTITDCSVNEPAAAGAQADCVLKAQLSAATPEDMGFDWNTVVGGTATFGDDLYSTSGSTFFAQFHAGARSYDMPVTVFGDDLDENNETFFVDLTNTYGDVTFADTRGVGTIVDSDASPTLGVTGCTVTEGNSGTVNCDFAYHLSAVSGRDVTFTTATANGTAAAGSDYNALSASTRTIPAGTTDLTVSVGVRGDTLDEANETFTLNATSISGATPTSLAATGTINDDDAPPTLSIDNGGCTVTEATGSSVNCNFVFRLSAASGRNVTFNTATANGTATTGSDYTGHASTARTIPAGSTTLTVAVPVLGDSTDEGTETFTLTASSITNATPATLTGTGTINDNDNAPTLSVDNGGCSVAEGDTGTANCAFVFRLSAASSFNVTFNTTTANGTATAPADYTAHTATARTIPAGQTTLTVNVPVVGDTLDEPNETFTLNATGVANATPSSLSATGTIVDNDAAPTLSVDNGGCTVTEGNSGSVNCAFVYRLSAASANAVTFSTATANVTATAASDYTAQAATARTIPAGQTTLTVNVAVLGDTLDEANETFTLAATGVTNASPATLNATGTITDDDAAPTLSVDNGGCTVAEGNTGSTTCNVVYRLSAVSGRAITFTTATANGTATAGADYTAQAATARTIAAGQTSLSVPVAVLGDLVDEPDETFTLAATAIANATPSTLNATVTISDDDAAPALSVDAGGCAVTEGDSGALNCAFVFRLSSASGYPVTFSTATANGTATAALDYTAHAATARTIAAGATTVTVNVPVLGDTLDETNETFTLNATGIAHATPASLSATGTITDNDAPPVLSVDSGGCGVSEGAVGTTTNCDFVFRLSAPSGLPVTFNTATANGTATGGSDFTAHAATARTLAPGQTTLTVAVPVIGDAVDEANENFSLDATSIANATPASLSATGTIIDDDGVPTVAIADCTVTEPDAGTTPCNFAATLSNASATTVTVAYATSPGTAVVGQDFNSATGTLTFAPGETSKTIAVAVLGDTRNELVETFTVSLSAPTNATLGDAQATGTIDDNDPLPLVDIAGCSVTEGNSGTTPCVVTVTLSAPSGRTVTVAYATVDGTATAPADYGAVSGTLSFAPGTTSKTITIAVVGDTLDEGNHDFEVQLSAPSAATLAATAARSIILDDDAPAGQVRLSSCHWIAPEQNATVVIRAERVNGSLGAITVPWFTSDDTAFAGQDYQAASGTLTWASGDAAPKTITVPLIASAAVEPDEDFVVAIGTPTGGATLAFPDYAYVHVMDGDALFHDSMETLQTCDFP